LFLGPRPTLPEKKNLPKTVYNFLSNLADRQTDRDKNITITPSYGGGKYKTIQIEIWKIDKSEQKVWQKKLYIMIQRTW